MKKIITAMFLIAIGTQLVKSQVPERFNYQGVLRDAANELITNTNIGLQVSLYEGSSSTTAVYIETHEAQTDNNGQFSVQVGTGTTTDNFTAIDWSSGQVYLKVSVDESGGTNYSDLPTVQLITVPYALFAKDVANKDDADADPNNEIQQLSFKNDSVFISGGNGIKMPYDSSNWVISGNTMYYNGGNVGIGSSTPLSNLEVKSNTAGTDALFQVINANNDTVFAVYPDGVKIFVDQSTKGKVGGFAVSGRSPNKANGVDILKVTIDSTRIYVSDTVSAKGKVGGFAVSGRSPNKGLGNEYLVITPDSTRVYVNDTSATKGKVGGFAVSGRSPNKGTANDYMRITKDSTRIYVTESTGKGKVGGFAVSGRSPNKGLTGDYFNVSGNESAEIVNNEPRVMWYPQKAALLAGEVHVGSSDSVGTNSTAIGYRNIAMGEYSQAFGYKAYAIADNSTSIGYKAKAHADNSYAFGDSAQAVAVGSYAIGTEAQATGIKSFSLGSKGQNFVGQIIGPSVASGDYSYAFGMGCLAKGFGSFAMGLEAQTVGRYSFSMGNNTIANGSSSIAIGDASTANDWYAVAIGEGAHANGEGAFAMGQSTNANSDHSYCFSNYGETNGLSSAAIGDHIYTKSEAEIVVGSYNNYSIFPGSGPWHDDDPIFVVGNGQYIFGTGEVRSNALVVLKGGELAIGNFAPTQMLDVDGNARFRGVGTLSSSNVPLYITSTGVLSTSSSDERLKTNITSLENGLDLVLKMRPVRFNWKDDPDSKASIGLIAQEFEKIVPELVFTNKVDGFKGINYAEISAILIEAVKEQQEIIQKQKEEISSLNKRLTKIEKMLNEN